MRRAPDRACTVRTGPHMCGPAHAACGVGQDYPRFVRELGQKWRPRRLAGWVRRIAEIGVLPGDSNDVRLRKAVLTLSSSLMAGLAFVWVITYAALGLWVSAAIPAVYQLASVATLRRFARTRRGRQLARSQL